MNEWFSTGESGQKSGSETCFQWVTGFFLGKMFRKNIQHFNFFVPSMLLTPYDFIVKPKIEASVYWLMRSSEDLLELYLLLNLFLVCG